jgi:hypothetical protein
MGANHGSGGGKGWFEVSETFAVRYGATKLACRLVLKTGASPAGLASPPGGNLGHKE